MSAVPWGQIAQQVSGLVGGVAGNMMTVAGNRRAQKRAERMNWNMWHAQNSYNDPSNQVARLKAAGLNPALMYGKSASPGIAGPIAPSKAYDAKVDNPLTHLLKTADLKSTEARTNNLQQQNDVILQEAALKSAQTAKVAQEGKSAKITAELAEELKQTSLDAASENLKNLKQKTLGSTLDNTFKDKSMKDRTDTIMFQAKNAKATQEGTRLLNTMRALEIDLKNLGIERGDHPVYRIFGRIFGNKLMEDLKAAKQRGGIILPKGQRKQFKEFKH